MSAARAPRWAVLIGGQPVPVISARVTTNVITIADDFEAVLPISVKPLGLTYGQFLAATSMQAEVRVGFPANPDSWSASELTQLIYADVDQITADPVKGTITITGRDLTRRFIDTKSPEKYQNLTPSDIATKLAAQQGLKAQVTPTPGGAKAGRFYAIDHVRPTVNESQWDLLTFLAQELNWVTYVQGDTLYFGPLQQPGQNDFVIVAPKDGSSVISMKLSRSLTVARDVIVKVRSWNQSQAKGFTVTAKAIRTIKTDIAGNRPGLTPLLGGNAQLYTYTIPNLTPDKAQTKANELLQNITRHELRVQVVMPGDVQPTKGQTIRIKGTDSVFDQSFYPFEIVREMDLTSGFTMTISMKNHSPQSTV